MKPINKAIIAASTMAIVGVIMAFTNIKKSNIPELDKGFAVIELFTSEGCSSCPPADALVAKVQEESAGKPIYVLAYHVDYWNRLGWKDPFSDAAYSARQNQYARWMNSSEIYTPQAIVNGTKEFIGSQEGTMRSTIKTDLEKPAGTEVTLSQLKAAGNKASLQYEVKGAVNNTALVIALIEKNATIKVARGENGGRTLSHVQIVRSLQNVNLSGHNTGSANVTLPAGFTPEGYEVIGFVQNTSNGSITGASRAEFSATLSK